MSTHSALAAALAACLMIAATPHGASAGNADAAYQDIGETYGMVPGFFRLFPRDDVAEAWDAFTALQLNPDIVMDAKIRELIGVAVSTQGSCRSCIYLHAAAALANGASEEEIREAVSVGAATRRLDTTFSDAGANIYAFKRETDLVLWGDARTGQLRGPSSDLCRFITPSANADDVTCD